MSSFYDVYHKDFVRTKLQSRILSIDNFTYTNFFRFILPVICRENSKLILDIGTGAGALSLYLASEGFKVTGIDVSKLAINFANESVRQLGIQNSVKFICGNFEKFSSTKKFDCVLFLEVIEHLQKDDLALKKIHDLLNPNGLMILSTPLKNAPLAKLSLTTSFDRKVGHIRRYIELPLLLKIQRSGFIVSKIIKTEGVVRNSLYVFPLLGFLIRFMKGYIGNFVTILDDLSGKLFGYSDILIFARKR